VKIPTASSATLATASGLFGSTPGYVTDGHPFFAIGVDEGWVVRRRIVAYLAKPNLPPFGPLNEPIKVILNVLPSLVTCNGMGCPRLIVESTAHPPVDALLAKNGKMCASMTSIAASTSGAPSCS